MELNMEGYIEYKLGFEVKTGASALLIKGRIQ